MCEKKSPDRTTYFISQPESFHGGGSPSQAIATPLLHVLLGDGLKKVKTHTTITLSEEVRLQTRDDQN
jgi:hypothetical protein